MLSAHLNTPVQLICFFLTSLLSLASIFRLVIILKSIQSLYKDNAIARHGILGIYLLFNVQAKTVWLKKGDNTIYFTPFNIVQRTLVETWGLIRESFVDPTFNHQDWDSKLQQTMVEMFPLRSADATYNKISGMLSTFGDHFTRLVSPKEY